MKNKNRKKSIIIAIVVVVLCLVGYKIADKVSYPLVRAKAVLYLADKYDAKISDFEMTDHIHSRFIIEDENPYDLKFKPKWKDFAFEFKYKDRKFIVNRYKGKFYDDYQLDDIEKWCTEWLQENVDNRITGVEISTHDILNYLSATKTGYNHVISKNETYDFLINYKENETKVFYYYDINGSTFYGVDENLGKQIKLKIGSRAKCSAQFSKESAIKKIDKNSNYSWMSWYKVINSIGE